MLWHDGGVPDGGHLDELAERLAELSTLSEWGPASPQRILRRVADLAAQCAPVTGPGTPTTAGDPR